MTGPRQFTAIVLAGSRPGGADPVAAATGVAYKCMAPIAGTPMVLRVLAPLAASPDIGRILLVADPASGVGTLAPVAELIAQGRLLIIPPVATPATSVLAALEQVVAFPVLVTTADHALLDAAILDHFLKHARSAGTDIVAGLASADVILAAYPDTRRTFWRFRDGRYSGANLFALLTPEAAAVVGFWRRVEMERKRPWRIARLFGLTNLLLYLSGRLTLAQAFARAGRAAGARASAIPIPIAEAAIDVDKPDDLALVERILRQRGTAV